MKKKIINTSHKRQLQFVIVVILLTVIAFSITKSLPKGGVWYNHLSSGMLFFNGSLPDLVTYPIWGYSLLAAVFNDNIIVFQGILMILLFVLWYRTLILLPHTFTQKNSFDKITTHPVFIAITLFPFIFLCLSYFSNSMANLFLYYSIWFLYDAIENKKMSSFIFSGLLIGLSFNIRSEIFLLGTLLFFSIVTYGIVKNCKKYSYKVASIFFVSFFVLIIPWMIFTKVTINKTLISSTNGGAVMYLNLGILPNNPWNIIDDDNYVTRIALEKNLGSPWSFKSDIYFKSMYFKSIKEYPISFIKKALIAWQQLLTQGPYIPNLRRYFAGDNEKEFMLYDFINEQFKSKLGFNVNHQDIKTYENMGITNHTPLFKHYAIVVAEYFLRFLYLCIFVIAIFLAILLSIKTKFKYFISHIFLAHTLFLFFVAAFIQTLPRHSTLLLPISILAIIILSKNSQSPTEQTKQNTKAIKIS